MKPQRIDAHQHFWQYRPEAYPWIGRGMELLAQDRLPGELHPMLSAEGLDASIAVQARAGREETGFLLELARGDARIAGVIGWEDIAAPQLAERVAEWGRDKLLGFRHQIQDERDVTVFTEQPAFNEGIAWLQDQRYVYDVLVYERQLPEVQAFCARHDRHWLVLDHLGKPALAEFGRSELAYARWKRELETLAALPHVACKLSGLVTEADWMRGLRQKDYEHIVLCLDTALDAFGPERLMFGSDWPVCLLAASYAKVAAVVREWAATRLSGNELEQLWGGTAARCYGLE
ncbi:amidohydrolase family protein [Herbaspirillum sp. LeCh32-8]|uniref:amidohydrolase family protein n=1 Tax=Herbaspirillum sp. LeCh32-8 TaxID=2821356 RepID=UPI001AE3FE97|nr:amidohydrolase family protein [Herbaspirillum sp. LeCh32-8]MBP0598683.1 amidohydrolase family protein [Herbaspirillum sp. LeCh32-8]